MRPPRTRPLGAAAAPSPGQPLAQKAPRRATKMTSRIETAASPQPGTPAAAAPAEPKAAAERPYAPGLEGVIAAETAVGFVDGLNGRLLYRGYPIGQLVEKGTYGRVAELLWTGEWRKTARLAPAEIPEPVMRSE